MATAINEQPGERGAHAEHERIGRRVAVGVVADHRLKQRCGALEGEGDEPDLAEIEGKRAFQHGIDRHDQRLDHVVQHVADADRREHRDHGAFGLAGARASGGGFLAAAGGCLCLDRHVLRRKRLARQNWAKPTAPCKGSFVGGVADGRALQLRHARHDAHAGKGLREESQCFGEASLGLFALLWVP